VLAIAVIAFFTLFFVIPLVWLLLAPTKSTTQLNALHGEQPLSFGSWGSSPKTGMRWSRSSTASSGRGSELGAVFRGRVGDHPRRDDPCRLCARVDRFQASPPLLVATLLVMLIPNTALVLPIFLEINAVHLVGTPLAVILPFSFFPSACT
jgi:multiple sugar transport system permease protein